MFAKTLILSLLFSFSALFYLYYILSPYMGVKRHFRFVLNIIAKVLMSGEIKNDLELFSPKLSQQSRDM